jgi:hypothetical protein
MTALPKRRKRNYAPSSRNNSKILALLGNFTEVNVVS